MTQFLPPRKQNGRPKKASITDKIQAIPTEAAQSRRSLRLSVAGKVSPTEPTESTDSIGDDDLSLNNSNASRTENKEIVFPRTSEPTRDLESSFAETSSKEYSTKTCAKSPATPKTPSILKNSKETEGTESPATERKKNRVHFGAESLPCESFSSPATIRRKTILERTPPIKKVSSTSNTDRSPENRSSPVPLTAFFPALIDCQEKIERIIPNLVTLCKKTVLDSAKRSLHAVGVRTVGDFAQLPRSQIEKFTWIKGRSSGARNALSQYERNWNSVKGTAECSRNQIKIDSEDVKDSVTSVSSENNLSVLEKTNSIQTESDTINTSDTPHNTSNVQNTSEQITFKFVNPENELTILNQDNSLTGSLPISTTPRKSLESSQSPASTLSNTVAFSSSTNGSSSPPITPEGKPVVTVRKNLAALFSENAKTQKMATDNVKENEVSFLQDSRLLQGICAKLSRAHWTKQLQTVNSVKIISIISQAAMFFKTVVQTRGGIEWDRIDNNKLSHLDHDFSVEEEVDELFGVFTRFARHHNHPVADSLPWSRVLYSLSNAAAVLEVICISLTTPT
uniref:CDT1 domain-containing protein n=1 Tax=Caenorhabditis tropicalis TaxID=1561998 RepID=A0A1I7V4N2_9PELO